MFNQGLICKTRRESLNATETTSQKVLSQNLFQFTKYVLIKAVGLKFKYYSKSSRFL